MCSVERYMFRPSDRSGLTGNLYQHIVYHCNIKFIICFTVVNSMSIRLHRSFFTAQIKFKHTHNAMSALSVQNGIFGLVCKKWVSKEVLNSMQRFSRCTPVCVCVFLSLSPLCPRWLCHLCCCCRINLIISSGAYKMKLAKCETEKERDSAKKENYVWKALRW